MRPKATQKQLVAAGRICVVLIALLSVAAASQITSIERAWKFFVAIGAGNAFAFGRAPPPMSAENL